jgi:hypothetical protein
MTVLHTRAIRRIGLTLVSAVSLLATATPGHSFSPEAQQMCSGDAFRLCSSEIPNIPGITACMIKKRSSLSAPCRTVLDRDLARQSSKVAAQ